MLKNAMRDHAEFAWIPSGDSCAFCMMLASQGWRRASRSTIAGNHAEHIHANCHCEFAIRFTSDFDVAGYEPKQLRKEWDAAEGNTTAEKLNYLRRKMHSSEEMKFETEKLLDIHYEKHAAKFGNISKEEYLKEANELMQKDTSDNIMELQRSDNSTSRYDRINNEFIVINEDDTIRTFFKPALGEEYWEYEKERNK